MRKTYITAAVIALATILWFASGALTAGEGPREHPSLAEANELARASVGDMPPTAVRGRVVHAVALPERVTVRGRTENKRTVDVRAETSGRIIERPLERGAKVGRRRPALPPCRGRPQGASRPSRGRRRAGRASSTKAACACATGASTPRRPLPRPRRGWRRPKRSAKRRCWTWNARKCARPSREWSRTRRSRSATTRSPAPCARAWSICIRCCSWGAFPNATCRASAWARPPPAG